jgi:subtilisin family serine protease
VNDFYLQALEPRSLLAADLSGPPPEGPAEPWSAVANLVRQDLARINHPGIDGAGQTIAVIDTGIDYTHPSLGGGLGTGFKVIGGHDFFDDDEDPIDTSGHGTGVAGVLASDPFVFEEHYYSGIAPAAKLVALRITDEPDDPAPDERVRDALQWVVDHRIEFGITVVNISFGFGHFDSDQPDGPFAAQIQALTNAGVAIVAASGNGGVSDGPGVDYPAADPNAIAVGAVDSFDVITDYTERSATLDMLAPGEDIISTTLGGEYVTESGTSFAAPMIAGTVALMRQADARLTVKESLSILRSSGIDNTDGDDEFGNVTNLGFPPA